MTVSVFFFERKKRVLTISVYANPIHSGCTFKNACLMKTFFAFKACHIFYYIKTTQRNSKLGNHFFFLLTTVTPNDLDNFYF